MLTTINFFRSRKIERIDYADIILFFEKDLKCKVSYGEEDVKFTYLDEVFNLEYNFYITKRSRVTNVAFINPEYVNIRFLIEVPVVLPEQASRQILQVIDSVCNRFDFCILYDGIKDVEAFDMLKLMNYFRNIRQEFLKNNPDYQYYTLPTTIISHISNYHQVMQVSSFLEEQFKEEVNFKKYIILSDGLSNEAKLAIEWEVGTPLLFPPHLDYIKIIDVESIQYLPADIFYKHLIRHMYELKNYLPDVSLLMLTGKAVKKAVSKVKRFKKHYVQELMFKEVNVQNLIEK